MALPAKITKTDAADLLGISRVTLDKRIDDAAYTWPPSSWADLHEQDCQFRAEQEGRGDVATDDARFRRARADNHEIEAARKRGDWAPVEMFEEQIVAIFGGFVQEAEGAEARLQRSAPTLGETIRSEFRTFRDNLARGVERFCEGLEKRARDRAAAPAKARRRVGANGKGVTAGERGAGAV